jgi:hypothetical protein
MLKNILSYRANIWLTAGAIIFIFAFLFAAVAITSRIEPLSADANMKSPKEDTNDKRPWYYIPGFGRYNYQEPSAKTKPDTNQSPSYNPRFGPK